MYDQPRCSEVGIAESRAISLSTARVAMLDKKAIGFGLFSCMGGETYTGGTRTLWPCEANVV